MHCHTAEHSSCSHAGAAEIAQRNFDMGLHGTVLTDHHYLWPPEEIDALRRNLKVPDYYLILSGQEVATPELGDVLVYGADAAIEKGTRLAIIRNRVPVRRLSGPIRTGRKTSRPATTCFIPSSTASRSSARITPLPKATGDSATGTLSSLPRLPEPIPTHRVTPGSIPPRSIMPFRRSRSWPSKSGPVAAAPSSRKFRGRARPPPR